MDAPSIIKELQRHGSRRNRDGMARFGIKADKAFGVCTPVIFNIAKKVGKDHALAVNLWKTGNHEARIMACMIDEPAKVTESQFDAWASEFDSWDVVDQCTSRLFDKTPFVEKKICEYAKDEREFVRRTAFSLIAARTVHDKKAHDSVFLAYLPLIKKYSTDERNFVRKAVNWALRQIGKRNARLNKEAIKTAKEIALLPSKSARWIAADALRELQGGAVRKRLSK